MTSGRNGNIGGDGNPNNDRTNDSNSSRRNSDNNSVFYRDIKEHLRALDFASFQNCVLLWLGAKRFRDICVLPRSSARGRRKIGGADFIASSPYDPIVKVAIQVRHWETPVQRRAVDELRGFMLRHGISQGLIVTTSVFYPNAIAAASEFPGRPIRMVSLDQLAGAMAALGLGVEHRGSRLEVSNGFFRTLGQLRLASALSRKPGLTTCQHRKSGCTPVRLDGVATIPPSRHEDPRPWHWILLALLVLVVVWLLNLGGLP